MISQWRMLKLYQMKQVCKVCGKNAQSDYCFVHKPRKAIKTKGPIKNTTREVSLEKDIARAEMKTMFLKLWETKPRKSEVSGTYLGGTFSSVFFHHILPKNKYPQAMNDVENIVILTLDEHSNVENDMYRYEEVNKRREYLKLKYDL